MGNIIHKGKGSFTFVENTIFYEHGLSMKAKGIYCQIRSLEGNPNWVFTIRGFATLAKDGVDAITAGVKELERSGYIVRARKRDESGRFVTAEDTLWITLDSPELYDGVVEELKEDGYAILSEFTSKNGQDSKTEKPKPSKPDKKPGQGTSSSRYGKSGSGKSTSGKLGTIKDLSNQELNKINSSSHGSEGESEIEDEGADEGGASKPQAYPEAFERLCEVSIKPVESADFKRGCFKLWLDRIREGFLPEEITIAYERYAKHQHERNGNDATFAKHLARWLGDAKNIEREEITPISLEALESEEPISEEEFGDYDKAYGRLWAQVRSRRAVVCSILADAGRLNDAELKRALAGDEFYLRYHKACEDRYGQYLRLRALVSRLEGLHGPDDDMLTSQ